MVEGSLRSMTPQSSARPPEAPDLGEHEGTNRTTLIPAGGIDREGSGRELGNDRSSGSSARLEVLLPEEARQGSGRWARVLPRWVPARSSARPSPAGRLRGGGTLGVRSMGAPLGMGYDVYDRSAVVGARRRGLSRLRALLVAARSLAPAVSSLVSGRSWSLLSAPARPVPRGAGTPRTAWKAWRSAGVIAGCSPLVAAES